MLGASLAPHPALAHAYVVQSTPAANQTVSGVRAVTVTFTEPVTIEAPDALLVWKVDGANADCFGGPQLDLERTRLSCRLSHTLAKGAYNVAWRVTSDDTHVVHGVFSFGVGVAVNAPSGETVSFYDPAAPLSQSIRWLSLVGVALVAGALAFDFFVLRAGAFASADQPAIAALGRACATLRGVGIVLALVASAFALDVQAAAATGSDALGALPRLGSIATGSSWGVAWILRVVSLIAIAFAVRTGPASIASLAFGAILLLSFSMTGHAVVRGHSSQATVPVIADWLHLTGAALWSGGLMVFAVGIRPALRSLALAERSGFAQKTIGRFSALALAAVATIVVSGVYASILHVGSFAALTGTTYGRVILAKIALLIPLLALGYGHYRQGRGGRARFGFATSVAFEAATALAVMGLSAILTGSAPPFPPPAPVESAHDSD